MHLDSIGADVNPEIRMFQVQHDRSGEITHAILCNGQAHYSARGSLAHLDYHSSCDAGACQGKTSQVLDVTMLDSKVQERFGLSARVPRGMVLVLDSAVFPPFTRGISATHCFGSARLVTPSHLAQGRLLAEGEGTTFFTRNFYSDDKRDINYVRNEEGTAKIARVGREDRKRTQKKLAKLRQGERKSEVSVDVSILNLRMQELMQLHRTPEVNAEIENVKELLRLASSLSVEASIEAAEGNEAIARELANSRAREISAELQDTRSRLLLEQEARYLARQEIQEIEQRK